MHQEDGNGRGLPRCGGALCTPPTRLTQRTLRGHHLLRPAWRRTKEAEAVARARAKVVAVARTRAKEAEAVARARAKVVAEAVARARAKVVAEAVARARGGGEGVWRFSKEEREDEGLEGRIWRKGGVCEKGEGGREKREGKERVGVSRR